MISKGKIVLTLTTIGLLIGLSFMITSCNKMTPAGFWKNYHKDLKIKEFSDQGPWGGYRIVHLETKNNYNFEINDILKYAKENGWTLIDSSEYGKNLPKSWTYSDKQIFPYNYNESIDLNNQINDKLQRWIDFDFKLFSFKTGWIIIKPGTDESTERTGFILVSNNKKKMTVYHLWGE
jgi:hypothetical protein